MKQCKKENKKRAHKSCSSFLGKPQQEEVTLNGGGETSKLTKHVIVIIISCNCSNRADMYSLYIVLFL